MNRIDKGLYSAQLFLNIAMHSRLHSWCVRQSG